MKTLFAVELTAEEQDKVKDFVENWPGLGLIEDNVLRQVFDQIPESQPAS